MGFETVRTSEKNPKSSESNIVFKPITTNAKNPQIVLYPNRFKTLISNESIPKSIENPKPNLKLRGKQDAN